MGLASDLLGNNTSNLSSFITGNNTPTSGLADSLLNPKPQTVPTTQDTQLNIFQKAANILPFVNIQPEKSQVFPVGAQGNTINPVFSQQGMQILSKYFVNAPGENVRTPFGTQANVIQYPSTAGGKIQAGIVDTAGRLAELIPRTVAELETAANVLRTGGKETSIPLAFNAQRIGSADATKYIGVAQRFNDTWSNLNIQNPDRPAVNGLIAFVQEAVPTIFDLTIAGDLVGQGAKLGLKATDYELTDSLSKLGFTREAFNNTTTQEFKQQVLNQIKDRAIAGDANGVRDIIQSLKVVGDRTAGGVKLGLKATDYELMADSLSKLGITREEFNNMTAQELKQRLLNQLNVRAVSGDVKGVQDVIQSLQVMRAGDTTGVTELNKFGQSLQNISKALTSPISDISNLASRPIAQVRKGLPGVAPKPGQAPAFGLSMKEFENVGGQDLVKKAEQSASSAEFEKALTPTEKTAIDASAFSVKGFFQGIKDSVVGTSERTIYNPVIGKIDILKGQFDSSTQKGLGMSKINAVHPDVVPYINEALAKGKIVEELPNQKILEAKLPQGNVRLIIDEQLGTAKGIKKQTFLNNAYFTNVPRGGVEPSTLRSSSERSTAELPRPTSSLSQKANNVKLPSGKVEGGLPGKTGLKKVGLAPEAPKKLVRTEEQLLKARIQAEARGAKAGFKAGATETRQKILSQIAEQKASVKEIKQNIADYANSRLTPQTRGKLLNTIKNAKTYNDLAKARDMINRIGEQSDKRALLNEIKKELKQPMYVGKGNAKVSKYSPNITKTLKSFKNNLSFKDPNSLKMKQLQLTNEWVLNHPDTPLPEKIINQLDELQRTHLNLLSNQELQEQLNSIKSLKFQGKTFKQLKLEQIKRDRTQTIGQFVQDITGGKGIKPSGPVIESQTKKNFLRRWATGAKNLVYERQLISDNLFDILDEKAGTPIYGGRIHEKFIGLNNLARDARIRGIQKSLGEVQPLLEKISKTLYKTVDLGNGIKMTRDEMIDVYMRSFDQAQLKSMVFGNKLSPQVISKIKSLLTKDEKAVAEAALKHWDENYQAMNNVFRERHLFDMPKNSGYSPMIKDLNYVENEDINLLNQQMQYIRASVAKGMTKERTGSLAPIKLGFVKNYVDSVVRAEHYMAYELPVQEMNAVLKGIKEAVVQERGNDYYRMLEEYVQKSANQGKYDTTYLSRFLLQTRAKLSTGILGLNPVTSIKHMTASIGGALTELSEKDFAEGIFKYFTKKKQWDAFWDQVPQFAERASSATRELYEVSQRTSPLQTALGKTSLSEKALILLRAGDKNVVRSEATAVYTRALKDGLTQDEAIAKAVSKLRRTQTGGAPEDLPSLMTGGAMEKMFTMFATEQNKYLNLLYGYSRAYAKGRVPLSKFLRVLFYTWIFNGIVMEEASKGGKATPQDLGKAVALGPLENMLILGNIIDAIRTGYAYDASPVLSIGADAVKYITDFTSGKVLAGLEGLGTTIGTASGIPIKPIGRTASGIHDLLTGQTKDWRRLFWSTSALGEQNQSPIHAEVQSMYDKVQALVKAGNNAEAQKIVDGMTDAQYKEYKNIKSTDLQTQITPTVKQVHDLVAQGKKDEAQKIVDGLTDSQYSAYKTVKKKLYPKTKVVPQPSYQVGDVSGIPEMIQTVSLYARAVGTDPITAFHRIFTNQRIRKIDNGTIIIARNTGTFGENTNISTNARAKLGATSDMTLDHIIPVELGGSDDASNLQLVSNGVAAQQDNVENILGKALKNGKINKDTAQKLIKEYKDGLISEQDVNNQLK